MTTVLKIFRLIASEFAEIDDDAVLTWIELTAPLASRKRFGKMYEQALALLTAHRMKAANVGGSESAGDGDLSDVGGLSAAFRVGGYSSGGESVNFNSSALTAQISADAEYSQTSYGIQYLTLRKRVVAPITCAGERG